MSEPGNNQKVAAGVGVAETHISTVFLTSRRAYKILKPVDLGFADFTGLSDRLAAVDDELTLNRRMAPDVYLGTADVHEAGELVDRMLVMRRMHDQHRLESILEACSAGDGPGGCREAGSRRAPIPEEVQDCIDAVVRQVAALHAGATPVRGDAAHMATRDAVRNNWSDNFEAIEPHVGSLIDADEYDRARHLALDYLECAGELFGERIEAGWVRDGHGDLRAEDIFCEPDGPRVLDCLAFSVDLRIADVLADVGFLAMDLIHLGFTAAADRVLSLYGELTAETHPRSLAQHYIAYRAHVRAKVCCLQYAQGDTSKAALAASMHRLAAERLADAAPRLVIVGGGPGTGKSTLARGLSDAAGLSYVGSDIVRKELAGLSPQDRAGAPAGEGIYTPEMSERTYREMERRAEVLLSHGEPVVLDASFTREADRAMARELARRRRVDLVELCCEVDRATALQRVGDRSGDPSDADEEIVEHMGSLAEPWPEATVIDTSPPVDVVVGSAVAALDRSPRVGSTGVRSRTAPDPTQQRGGAE